MGKKVEGNEDQRRKKAREAREHGLRASQVGGTLGSTKQRDDDHDTHHPKSKADQPTDL